MRNEYKITYKKSSSNNNNKKMTSDLGIYYGCDKIFKDNITDGIIYGEYRCWASTIYVSKKSNGNIISVDSSEDWINKIKE